MKLSKYFTYKEMTKTYTRLPNKPSCRELVNIMFMCSQVLDPIRELFGDPVIVNSGFRSVAVNKAVGGVPCSRHTLGLAADIRPIGCIPDDDDVLDDLLRLYNACVRFRSVNPQLVEDIFLYDTFIHIELKGGVTNEVD